MTTFPMKPTPGECFAMAAMASYRKHFADPVAAAEADLLGAALAACRSMLAILDRQTGVNQTCLHCGRRVPFCGAAYCSEECAATRIGSPQSDARAVLQQTKEPA